MIVEELGDGLAVFTVLTHAEGQALQTQIQVVGTLGALHRAQIPHELGGALGDECALQAKPLGVGHTVIAVIGGAQAGELVRVFGPVKFAGIHDAAAHSGGVAVHILGGGVGDDVRAPLKGPAVYGSGEGVVHDQGHAVGMGRGSELLDVQHVQGGVGDGLAEQGLGVGSEGGVQLLLGAVRVHEGGFDAHALHGHAQQIETAAVDGGAGNNMVAAGSDVKKRVEVGCLTGAGKHGGGAALHGADLGCHHVAGGVLKPGVEIAAGFQVEELAHILTGGILEGGALINGDLAGLAIFGAVAGLDSQGL